MKSPSTKDIQTTQAGKAPAGQDFFFPKNSTGKPLTIRAKSIEEAEKELAKKEEEAKKSTGSVDSNLSANNLE